jgi:serine/threonine protein kinase
MADSARCEQCGGPVTEHSPWGLCPACLLRTAIDYGAGCAVDCALPELRYFGDYELLEEIARGGMGVVYRARQVSLDRIVAVKMMRPGLVATDAEIQRFRAEARTAAFLRHPNIVAIHEVGEFDGLHYFSMDFVEGPSLAALVREHPLAPAEAARHVHTLAEAVEYAHSRGVLHRDLKPSNILLDATGRLHISDFGLARPLKNDSGTAAGTIVGTPAYMPPEQAAGEHERLSPASDVYSLGAILYELLTGVPPFRDSRPTEIVRQVKEVAPLPPSQLNPRVGRDLETTCLRCLEKDPARRYRTAAQLGNALAALDAPSPKLSPRLWRYAFICAITIAIVMMVRVRLDQRRVKAMGDAAVLVLKSSRAEHPSAETPAPTLPRVTPVAKTEPKSKRKAEPTIPVVVSIDPGDGDGPGQLFHLRFNSPLGAEDIEEVGLFIEDSDQGCIVFADPRENRVSIQANPGAGTGIRYGAEAGTLQFLENPVCSVDLSRVSFTAQGKDLEVSLPISFKGSFSGPKEVTSRAWDRRMRKSANEVKARWRVS